MFGITLNVSTSDYIYKKIIPGSQKEALSIILELKFNQYVAGIAGFLWIRDYALFLVYNIF